MLAVSLFSADDDAPSPFELRQQGAPGLTDSDDQEYFARRPPAGATKAVMGFAQEFREFAAKGNVVDLAVGVIVGAAFGKIVDSLVKDMIMPVIGRVIGGLDFSNYFLLLKDPPPDFKGPATYEALTKAGVPLFAYGNFITVCLNFLILAFVIFVMVRQINRLKRSHAAAEVPPVAASTPEDVLLLREIRDALKK